MEANGVVRGNSISICIIVKTIKKIFIIGEIGINHNGDMSICKELIDVATDSGCNAAVQKRDIEKVYSQEILDSLEKVHGVLPREIKSWVWSLAKKIIKRLIATVKSKGIRMVCFSLGY